ncbi:DUF1648 domain-containing protein [Spongiivirga sp. MCCC 1A20706]|uniref:DUF1648 domain-containing protein n=1 Tax=Spongiivirga sp. MCCC 1A20706 TaxID=3160963 RepID=UPI0039778B0B
MNRPKIELEKDTLDLFVEATGVVLLLALIVLPIVFYSQLPEKIPTHFGADGTADNYGSKDSIWFLPVIGTILFVGMFILNKHPHIFNYPTRITVDNAKRQYKNATKLIRFLNTTVVLVFTYITFSTINIALGKQEGLGTYFLLAFLALVFVPVVYHLFKAFPKK